MTLTAYLIETSQILESTIYTFRVDVGGVATVHAMIDVTAHRSGDMTIDYINGGCPFSAPAAKAFKAAFVEAFEAGRTHERFQVEVQS